MHRRRASTACAGTATATSCAAGAHRFEADNVVVASGTLPGRPIVPGLRRRARPARSRSCTPASTATRRSCRTAPVLVVGAATPAPTSRSRSRASTRRSLAGHGPRRDPVRHRGPGRRGSVVPVLWFVGQPRADDAHAARPQDARRTIRAHGGPLLRVKRAHLAAAGVERTDARVDGRARRPAGARRRARARRRQRRLVHRLRQGRLVDRAPGHRRGRLARAGARRRRGVARACTSSACPFLHAFASMLVGGVGPRRRARRRAHRRAPARLGRAGADARSRARRLTPVGDATAARRRP